jgi:hypothetical protein
MPGEGSVGTDLITNGVVPAERTDNCLRGEGMAGAGGGGVVLRHQLNRASGVGRSIKAIVAV